MARRVFCLLVLSAAAVPSWAQTGHWVKVNEGGGGIRRGAAVVWLREERKFLVLGGGLDNPKRKIARPDAVQTFDPAAGAWANVAAGRPADKIPSEAKYDLLVPGEGGRLVLNPRFDPAGRSAFDPAGRRVYLFQAGNRRRPGQFAVAAYDVASRRWALVSTAGPPAATDGLLPGEWGATPVFLEGVATVYDPVNGEVLLIGGRTGNAPRGFVGHWAFRPDRKTWRRLAQPSEALDPLRAACQAALVPARDALAAARNVYYAGLAPADRAEAGRGRPAELLERATRRLAALGEALAGARVDGWEEQAVSRARGLVGRAGRMIGGAAEALAAGRLDANALKRLADAAWRLDEAGDRLRAAPGPRMHAGAGYDPARRCVVLFGGDRGDCLLNDTWVYDCAERTWRRVFPAVAPEARRVRGGLCWLPKRKRLALVGGESYVPEFIYFRRTGRAIRDVWTFDAAAGQWHLAVPPDPNVPWPTLTCQRAGGAEDTILGLASEGRYPSQWDGTTWRLRPGPDAPPELARKHGTPPGTRTVLSVVKQYDPCWYDRAGPGDPHAVAKGLAALKPNTWTPVPLAPRPAPRRDWGTAAFDPHRDQFYHWTGGHMADPASIVSTYHVAAGRWSIPYVAEYFGKGIGFRGRPDCMNHTYLNYAYDPNSQKLVCTSLAGTCVYDPDRREFDPPIAQPFSQHPYYTKTVGTPRGVVCWNRGGYLGVLDVAGRTWRKLPVVGELPRVVHGDENALTYDPKRDALWMLAADGYQKPNGRVWRYDVATGRVAPTDPAGRETIGVKVRPRESVYLPKLDLVLHNAFAGGRQIAYDPAANRWVTLAVAPAHKDLGGVSIGLMYDPRRDLVWAMASAQRMFVLRIDASARRAAPAAAIRLAGPEAAVR